MFLGFNESLKPLKQELKNAGADGSVVRDWMKTYDKVNTNYAKVEKLYLSERTKLMQLQQILKQMESYFTTGEEVKDKLVVGMGNLKALKDFAGHEFLIDKGNTEFTLTFSRLQKQSLQLEKYSNQELLFLHSEVENLMDIVKEALEKEEPDLHALTYFELTQKSSMLSDLPHAQKIKKIRRIYESEFLKPMAEILSGVMDKADCNMPLLSANADKTKEERINYILEDWIWKY